MAERYESGLPPRTFFKAPRVPFDFRALALGILGWVVFWAGGLLWGAITDKDVNGSFLTWFAGLFQGIPYIGGVIFGFVRSVFEIDLSEVSDNCWHILLGGVWFFVVWSFFGQAIHRVTSLRIARDEGLSLGQAMRFGAKNWLTMLQAPAIILAAMGFFYLCNAVAGAVTSIPFVGGIFGLILFPLAVISTLLMLLIGLGGVIGLPLIGAAAAWEVNGPLDAISRAFSYVFARPIQYFWNFFLIFLFTGVILLVGSWFNHTLLKSIDAFSWADSQSVLLDAPGADDADAYEALSVETREQVAKLTEETGLSGENSRPDGSATRSKRQAFVLDFQAVIHTPWSHKLNALMLWLLSNLIWVGVFGYAVYWLHGAATSVYADLREDVDGTESIEIWVEDDDEAFDILGEAGPATEAGASDAPDTEAPSAPAAAEAPSGDDAVEAPDEGDAPAEPAGE